MKKRVNLFLITWVKFFQVKSIGVERNHESNQFSVDKKYKPGFYKQANLFYNFVKYGKYDNRLCTLSQSKEVIEIIEQLAPK